MGGAARRPVVRVGLVRVAVLAGDSQMDQSDNDARRQPSARLNGDVVCFGFLTYSLLLSVDSLPPPNGGTLMRQTVETVGDDAAIVASILTSWDVPARLMSSPIGSDYYGDRVRDHLDGWGVDVDGRLVEGFETPLEVAILDADGGRTYFQRREPSALATLTPPTAAELSGAALLYVDWYDGPSVAEAAATASSLGVPVYLNLESRYEGENLPPDLFGHADICQVSLDEPEALGSPHDVARFLMDRGVGTVLVTMGSEGSMVARGDRAYRVRSPATNIVDCFGAGAAFSAGAVYGLREGWPLERVARFATAYSGMKCGVTGMAALSIGEIERTAAALGAGDSAVGGVEWQP